MEDCNVDSENRKLLVRIVVPSAAESRDMVIKATNSQTSVKPASLRATDKIHRDIEEYLCPKGLYYDRRKNFIKRKPRNKIIGIPYLAWRHVYRAWATEYGSSETFLFAEKDDDYVKIF
ncbi:MAG: AIPR family protein [Candidatus Azotimanducaceae bacterium WSBS_2022_MAG_OTU7]